MVRFDLSGTNTPVPPQMSVPSSPVQWQRATMALNLRIKAELQSTGAIQDNWDWARHIVEALVMALIVSCIFRIF